MSTTKATGYLLFVSKPKSLCSVLETCRVVFDTNKLMVLLLLTQNKTAKDHTNTVKFTWTCISFDQVFFFKMLDFIGQGGLRAYYTGMITM